MAVRRCGEGPGFLWKVIRRDGGGLFILAATPNRDQQRRMEVAAWGKRDHDPIQIWGPNLGGWDRSQIWDFVPVGNGFLIMSVDSDKCLNIPLGANPVDQEFLQQYTCARHANDTWRLERRLLECR